MLRKPLKPQQKLWQISAVIGTGFFKGEVRTEQIAGWLSHDFTWLNSGGAKTTLSL